MDLNNTLSPLKLEVALLMENPSCMEKVMDGIEGSLDRRKVGFSTSCYGSSQISELRIFISISRFISLLMSFDSIPKPYPHLVKLAYNLSIVSLVGHLSHHRNVWHMQDAQLHKSKLEPQDHLRP